MHRIGIVGEAAHQCERVIDVAIEIVGFQLLVAGALGCDTDLLCAPVDVSADGFGREQYEPANAGMGVIGTLGMCVPTGGRAEREQGGRFLPSRPIGNVALLMKPTLSRNICRSSMPGS